MPDRTRIATCSYCGTRAVLDFSAGPRHELICTACGAHLSEMKPLRADHHGKPSPVRRAPHPDPVPRPASNPHPAPNPHPAAKLRKPKKGKRRKSPLRRFADTLEDAFDAIEDIFD